MIFAIIRQIGANQVLEAFLNFFGSHIVLRLQFLKDRRSNDNGMHELDHVYIGSFLSNIISDLGGNEYKVLYI